MLLELLKSSRDVQSADTCGAIRHAPEEVLSLLLPLFPLDLVLLPGASLPLHIFEPRYKEMIGECVALKRTFGVVRARKDGVADIGCTAEVIEVTKEYPNGEMDILTLGRERFEVMQVNEERSFLQAEVLFFDDEPGTTPDDQQRRAMTLRNEILQLAGVESAPELSLNSSPLSFRIVAPLPLDLDFKQILLGMKSEAERILAIVTYFETILPGLRRSVQVRQKAGGNGHAG